MKLILIVNLELWYVLLELGSSKKQQTKKERKKENVAYCQVLASLSNRLNHFSFFFKYNLFFLFYFAVDKFTNEEVKLAFHSELTIATTD